MKPTLRSVRDDKEVQPIVLLREAICRDKATQIPRDEVEEHAQTRVREPGSTFAEPSDRQRVIALGGEVDVPVSDRFSIRAVQADYLAASAFGSNRNSFRFSTGLIVKFGKR